MRRRVLVDTTNAARTALNQVLHDSQLTLADWFETQVWEDAPRVGVVPDAPYDLRALSGLRDKGAVLRRLATVDWGFQPEDTGYLSHDLHPYAAKFIPQIPGVLISALSLRGELIWDPFGGSGTTALEAVLRGRRATSTDANPLAAVIGAAKTSTLTREASTQLEDLRLRLLLLSEQPRPSERLTPSERKRLESAVPAIPNLEKWFHPNATSELGILRVLIADMDGPAANVARITFSKIIVRASFQDSETRYASKPHTVATGATLRLFAAELKGVAARVRQLGTRLQFRQPTFATVDLRQPALCSDPDPVVKADSVALIVTSPPYPNAMDYHLYHRFRLFWLGYDPKDLAKVEIGSHLRHQREKSGLESYVAEMKSCLANCLTALQTGRYAAYVAGDCVYEGTTYNTADHISEAAHQVGFEVVGSIPRTVHLTKRSFIPAARRLASEQIVLLRKPPAKVTVSLHPPPYKLWPYENELRKREASALLPSPELIAAPNGDLDTDIDCYDMDRITRLTFTHSVSVGKGVLRTWQATLENGDATEALNRKDPKYVTHGIHPYKGKFYPQLAKALFNLSGIEPGDLVLDPYCGSGTVLLEAKLNGLRAVGFDVNPFATAIAEAKCAILDEDHLLVDRVLGALQEQLRNPANEGRDKSLAAFTSDTLPELKRWFAPTVLEKLSWSALQIAEIPVPAISLFLKVLLSSIIRQVSQQDPEDLRIRRRATALTDAPVHRLMLERVLDARARLRDFSSRLDRSPFELLGATVKLGDVTSRESIDQELARHGRKVRAVITSPPYATALPYVDTYRLNMLAVWGMTSSAREAVERRTIGSREISLRERREMEEQLRNQSDLRVASSTGRRIVRDLLDQNVKGTVGFRRLNMAALIGRYFEAMTTSMANVDRWVADNGHVFVVIGDNQTTTAQGPMRIATTHVLTEIADGLDWKLMEAIPITVTRENYRHSHHSISENTILWFVKK